MLSVRALVSRVSALAAPPPVTAAAAADANSWRLALLIVMVALQLAMGAATLCALEWCLRSVAASKQCEAAVSPERLGKAVREAMADAIEDDTLVVVAAPPRRRKVAAPGMSPEDALEIARAAVRDALGAREKEFDIAISRREGDGDEEDDESDGDDEDDYDEDDDEDEDGEDDEHDEDEDDEDDEDDDEDDDDDEEDDDDDDEDDDEEEDKMWFEVDANGSC